MVYGNASPQAAGIYAKTVPGTDAPSTLDQPGALAKEVQVARQGLFELRARLLHLGDSVVGSSPQAQEQAKNPEPGSLISLISEISMLIGQCHNELSRTTNILGL